MSDDTGKAKYYIVMDKLRQQMISGKVTAGDKLPSENELVREFHVSRHTIRKALSILESEGYVEAVHGKGTFCTERFTNKGNSHNVAVVTTYISDYIFPRLIKGIDTVLTKEGYSIILKNTGNSQKNEAKALEDIMTKNIDGVIIEPSKSEIFCKHMHQYEQLDKMGIPYVFLQGTYPQMKDKPNIVMDDVEGGYLLTKYLLDLGHRHLVGIFKIDDSQGTARQKGFIKAMNEKGLVYDPDSVILFHTEDRATKPAGMIRQFIQDRRPIDAIICYNDQIALEVIKVLEAEGRRVPQDISVTGYDNSFLAENGSIKLTTIAHPKERLGEMIAELLLEKIRGVSDSESKVERVIKPELIIRESCTERKKTSLRKNRKKIN